MDTETQVSGPLVLVVDDEAAFREILSLRLSAAGMRVVEASSADEAIRIAGEQHPDLVLSDVSMPPGRSGWDLAFALRANPATAGIPFAFLTSLHDPWAEFGGKKEDRRRILADVSIIDKTNDFATIGDRARRLIENAGRPR